MKDIFKYKVAKEKLDNDFLLVDEFNGFLSAKKIIEEISRDFEDKDGNFVQQFQTTGFDARLWAIFLFALFSESWFEISSGYDRPDFYLKKKDSEIFVEASVSNEKEGDIYTHEFIKEALELQDEEIQNELIDYYVIRLGSVLFSK